VTAPGAPDCFGAGGASTGGHYRRLVGPARKRKAYEAEFTENKRISLSSLTITADTVAMC
jgi:hypothetical protein